MRCRDHPRMRGEQCVGGATTAPRRGSPPHARGADRLIFTDQSRCRITPACAGSSHQQINNRFNDQDHPRMRGEQSPGSAGYRGGWGSPPHARGAVPESNAPLVSPGITPACAGSRVLLNTILSDFRDHPRMRGEQLSDTDMSTARQGSPPHARGAASTGDYTYFRLGITPACAGSRFNSLESKQMNRDHPRMRGEQSSAGRWTCQIRGSPPHARGAVDLGAHLGLDSRITPACAGSRQREPTPSG